MATISDILQAQGDAAAKARQARGTMWGSLAQYAGTIPREIIAGEQQKREQAQVAQVRQLQIQKGQAEAAKADEERGKTEVLRQVYRVAIDPTTGKLDRQRANAIIAQSIYPDLVQLLDEAQQHGLDKELEASVKRSTVAENTAHAGLYTAQANAVGKPDGAQDFTLPPGSSRYDAKGNLIVTAPAGDKPDTRSLQLQANDALKRGDTAEYQRLRQVIKDTAESGHVVTVNTGSADDKKNVEDAMAAMGAGDVPPLLPGRASKEYVAMIAEAKRQGVDLSALATDWLATQKHIASLNGTQQLRLNQSIGQLPELLDTVDALASQWKGGRFPILNRANLAAAKGGAYGDQVASVAQQLDAQIADITSDLGNVYMGGNSPTDKALALAGTALKGDWSEKVLHDMVALAKKNVIIRQHSIANTGVMGASPDNPYAPTQAAPPAAPTAPAGWKYVPKAGGGWTAVEDK